MDWSVAKAYLNTLKCPICNSRLDLYELPDKFRKYNFCCSSNWEHYRIFFVHWEAVLRVEYESVIMYERKHKYEITQYEDNHTEILVLDVDPENRVIDNKEKVAPLFKFPKHLFDFKNTTKEKVLNRVKTILVFS